MGFFSQGLKCSECGKFLDTGAPMVAIGKVPPIDNIGRFDLAIQRVGKVLCLRCFEKIYFFRENGIIQDNSV